MTFSGAGAPLERLYLIPKSALGPRYYGLSNDKVPPGLCDAVRRIPPVAFLLRMMWEVAGVDKMPSFP